MRISFPEVDTLNFPKRTNHPHALVPPPSASSAVGPRVVKLVPLHRYSDLIETALLYEDLHCCDVRLQFIM